ncbi:WD40-repeat-containing domain protein [Gongronella butleri]|nr:WD40-repeat-containing domain protein [Gongronella butleri]
MSTSADSVLTCFDQASPCGFFAMVTEGVDQHHQRLRVFDTTGTKTHDDDLPKDLGATALVCGVLASEETASASSKKAKAAPSLGKVLALVTERAVHLYSVQRGVIVTQLGNPLPSANVQVALSAQGTNAYTLTNDGSIIGWDLVENLVTIELKTSLMNPARIAISHDGSILAVAGDGQIELWDIIKARVFKTFSTTEKVASLQFTAQGDWLVSHDEQKVQIWNALTSNKKQKPAKTLVLSDDDQDTTSIRSTDLVAAHAQGGVHVLALTHAGHVVLWPNVSEADAKRVMEPVATISIVSAQNDQPVRIRRAAFTKSAQPAVVVARGSIAQPILETIDCVDDNKKWRDITLTRQTAQNESMGTKSIGEQPRAANAPVTEEASDEFVATTLLNALQAGEDRQVMKLLRQPSILEDMDTIVKTLPAAYGHMLLLQVLKALETRVQQDMVLVNWLKQLVLYLNDSIKDNPGIVKRLAKLSRSTAPYALETLPRTLALQARVQMIQLQIDMRQKRAQFDDDDAQFDDDNAMATFEHNDQQILTDEDDDDAFWNAAETDDMFMEEQGGEEDDEDQEMDMSDDDDDDMDEEDDPSM